MKYLSVIFCFALTFQIQAGQGVFDFENIQRVSGGNSMAFRMGRTQGWMRRADVRIQVAATGDANFGAVSLSPFNAPEANSPYILDFLTPVTGFSLDFGDADPDADILTLKAYSDYYGRGILIDSVTETLPASSGFNQKRLTVKGVGIKSVVFIGGSSSQPNSVYYDNFKAASKPLRASFDSMYADYGFADYTVYRPSDGTFYTQLWTRVAPFFQISQFGISTDKSITGDYDGDNVSDLAVFRDGTWHIRLSASNQVLTLQFGLPLDIPLSADFDNDGKSDVAVFRPSNGTWYILRSSDFGFMSIQFGMAGDIPLPANYDNDGRSDFTVFRPSDGTWYMLLTKTESFRAVQFGTEGDKAVPADYDGDGQDDLAVYRGGIWYLLQSRDGFSAVQFGLPSDIPVPNDYFDFLCCLGYSDGKAEIAVWRPESGVWYVLTRNGFYARQWGRAGDIPISLP